MRRETCKLALQFEQLFRHVCALLRLLPDKLLDHVEFILVIGIVGPERVGFENKEASLLIGKIVDCGNGVSERAESDQQVLDSNARLVLFPEHGCEDSTQVFCDRGALVERCDNRLGIAEGIMEDAGIARAAPLGKDVHFLVAIEVPDFWLARVLIVDVSAGNNMWVAWLEREEAAIV